MLHVDGTLVMGVIAGSHKISLDMARSSLGASRCDWQLNMNLSHAFPAPESVIVQPENRETGPGIFLPLVP